MYEITIPQEIQTVAPDLHQPRIVEIDGELFWVSCLIGSRLGTLESNPFARDIRLSTESVNNLSRPEIRNRIQMAAFSCPYLAAPLGFYLFPTQGFAKYPHYDGVSKDILIASPFIQAQCLEDFFTSRRPFWAYSKTEQITMIWTLFQGVSALHTFELAHFDIHPKNILVIKTGNMMYLKLIDFELCTLLKEKPITRSGRKGYIQPERQNVVPVLPNSDVYALGATLAHLLSGYKLIEDEFCLQEQRFRIITQHYNGNPALAFVIAKMMAWDPPKRYQSVMDCFNVLLKAYNSIT